MKRKKLEIEAYTYDKSVFENFKWTSKVRKPTWWKNLVTMYTVYNSKSGIMVPTPTVKACPGITQYIQKAIVMKLWSDMIFRVTPDGKVSSASPLHSHQVGTGMHEQRQYGDDLYPGYAVLKIEAPWYLKTKKPVDFMNSEFHYSEDLRKHGILVAPGVLNFYDQHAINVFLLFPLKDEPYEVRLNYGSDLMAIYPMEDVDVSFKNIFVDSLEQWGKINDSFPRTFLGRYYTRKRTARK